MDLVRRVDLDRPAPERLAGGIEVIDVRDACKVVVRVVVVVPKDILLPRWVGRRNPAPCCRIVHLQAVLQRLAAVVGKNGLRQRNPKIGTAARHGGRRVWLARISRSADIIACVWLQDWSLTIRNCDGGLTARGVARRVGCRPSDLCPSSSWVRGTEDDVIPNRPVASDHHCRRLLPANARGGIMRIVAVVVPYPDVTAVYGGAASDTLNLQHQGISSGRRAWRRGQEARIVNEEIATVRRAGRAG